MRWSFLSGTSSIHVPSRLRSWSDLGDDGTISVTHALGNGEGGFYLKEPRTASSRRTIPLTKHTFVMMISGGNAHFARYVRTVASYLGHASVSMTLDVYADVDPKAKKAAFTKVDDAFDMDMMSSLFGEEFTAARQEPVLTFSVEQLEAMLAQARARQAEGAMA